ncbi:PREDICTED: uncharacterized protein At3g49140-like isoform X2 [Nelumbo nucifera]|uniref:Uncharacterized protein At3g49140-like isoform X2 n=1 Tax=Nelumbo nucifera TaxID=4432 RepID=A0A1U8BCG5_NELNU|nr:PREDICTED: uncharacterized protein At3g49140-like isoform X2 [Nelumbo nucifera]
MVVIESALAVGFRTAGRFCSSGSIANYRPLWSTDDPIGLHISSGRLSHGSSLDLRWNRVPRLIDGCSFSTRNNVLKTRVRATENHSGPTSNPLYRNRKPYYHPLEEIAESTPQDNGEDAILTAAETARTIIEVNSKAALIFSGLINDEVHESIFWPQLPYVTDEHGDVYFKVNEEQGILQENNYVQVIIGLDTIEMLREMELSGPSDIDFGIEEITEEDGDDIDDNDDEDRDEDEDGDYEKDWVAILEDEEDELDSDETLGDWAKLETMRSSHPMYFAKKLAEAASDLPIDWMEQPSVGLAIQGLLTPVFVEEAVIQEHIPDHEYSNGNSKNQVGEYVEDKLEDIGMVYGHQHELASSEGNSIWAEQLEIDESLRTGVSFYKLEMVKIQMISAHGNQTAVDVKDFQKAKPDAIAHYATKIISSLKAGGEKVTKALKSLCWRRKNIQVEEAMLVGVDSLGFDLRVCSGTQVQTLRFAFKSRATSEYSAERQLHDLLFPRIHHKLPKRQHVHKKES